MSTRDAIRREIGEFRYGRAMGYTAAREVAKKHGLALAENNLRDLEQATPRTSSHYDLGYLAGYRAGIKDERS